MHLETLIGVLWERMFHVPVHLEMLSAISPLGDSSVQLLSCAQLFESPWQHARLPCPSPTPGAYSNSCPLSQWCCPNISSSVVSFSSCPQSCPASGSFQMSQLSALGGQSIGASASKSVLPMNIKGWFPLGLTGLISLLPKETRGWVLDMLYF